MDRFCSNCGEPLAAEARFCPACGSRAPDLDPAATIASARRAVPPPEPAAPAGPAPAGTPLPPAAPPRALTAVLRETWERVGSLELGLAAAFAAAAILFSIIGLILSAAADPGSSAQVRGQVWQGVAIVAAGGAAAWALVARERLKSPGILSGRRDQRVLWGLAAASAVFLFVGFVRMAGYDVASDLESGADSYLELAFPSLDESAWVPFALALALLTFGWAVLTPQLSPGRGRRIALSCTGVAAFFSIGALIIGHFGDDDNDVYDALVRSAAWHGLALVLIVLAAAALFGRRPQQPGE